jgi:hypothetical protein
LDIILSRYFPVMRGTRIRRKRVLTAATAHIGRQRGFTIEAICRMHPGNLWVFVARAKEARGRDSKCKMSSLIAWKILRLEDFGRIWKNMVNTFRSTQCDATSKATSKLVASGGCDFQ